jgi:hypothetical protein
VEAPAPQGPRVAILVGLPASIRAQLEQRFKGRLFLRIVPMRRDGGYKLELPPRQASHLIENFADQSVQGDGGYDRLVVVLLPYANLPTEVEESARVLEDLGAEVLRPAPGTGPWPKRSPKMDQDFQGKLRDAIATTLEARLPRSPQGWEDGVIEDLLRALVTHSKMGPNNHSHEDDLWKSCEEGIASGEKRRIEKKLMAEGILDRKQNDSQGGRGWVYWISNVTEVRVRYPGLEPYFGDRPRA